jgi:hypothetical protein
VTAAYSLETALTGSNSTPVTTATFTSATSVAAQFPAGAWIMIQDPAEPDHVHLARLTAATTTSGSAPNILHTLTFAGHGLKSDNNFPAGSVISRVNAVGAGSKDEQPFFSAKVIGILPEGNKPVGLLFAKIRMTRGFSMAFSSENFSSMPFQFTVYDLVSTDPHYEEFKDSGPVRILTTF